MSKHSSFFLACAATALAFAACGGADSSTVDGTGGGDNDAGQSSGGDGGTGGKDGGTASGDGSSGTADGSAGDGGTSGGGAIKRLFVILMENHSWTDIKGSSSAPYINNTLLPMAAHAEQYFTPTGVHPSEPNYIWMEAGDRLGVTTDDDPATNHQSTTDHLVTHLQAAGKSWKAYAEDIDGKTCPLTSTAKYLAKHTPMVFFDDVTNTNDANSANCIAHVRPYTELATDLMSNMVADYNFITPNACDDMHGTTGSFDCVPGVTDLVKSGDTFLSTAVPAIMNSAAYKDGGALFIVWDEGSGIPTGSDGPIPFFALGANVKKGYASMTKYTHSSLLRSTQEIFGITPFIRDAANATDFADMFTSFP